MSTNDARLFVIRYPGLVLTLISTLMALILGGGSFWLTTVHGEIQTIEGRLRVTEDGNLERDKALVRFEERLKRLESDVSETKANVEYIRRLLDEWARSR